MLNMSICRAVRARVQKKKVKMFSGRSPSKLSNKATWRSLCRVTFEILPSRALIFEGNPSHSDSGLLAGPFTIGIPIIISQKHQKITKIQLLKSRKMSKIMRNFIFWKKICFFVAVSWAEILRLPHSFRLWGVLRTLGNQSFHDFRC